jgi:hypothetical protein
VRISTVLRAVTLMLAVAATLTPWSVAVAQMTGSPTRLLDALRANTLPLTMSDGRPGGAGWDWLVRQAAGARFTVIGEEHGVAETAQLSAALFSALRASGYSRLAIELSPVITQDIETAGRRGGFQGIADFLSAPGVFTFYNMREEVQFLADVLRAAPAGDRVLWELDREIFSDRYLISRLESRVPMRAREAFMRLKQASENAKAKNERTGNPDDLFFLAEDPALVSALRSAWPDPDRDSDAIMRTIEESLAIEAAERAGGIWPYLQRRAQWKRSNMARLLSADQGRNTPPKVMMKFGYNHAIRGANYFNVFDVGAMADEVAALTGDRAFHILVLPGPGSRQAVLGGAGFSSVASDSVDEIRAGNQRLARVLPNANATGHEVIDLRPLRPLAMRGLESWNADVVRTIHGFDAVVIWKGARASAGLRP